MKKILLFWIFLSSVVSFTSSAQVVKTTFTDDRDGHIYNSVKIGNQIWMTENLAYLPRIDKVEDGVFDADRFWVYNYFGNSVEEAKRAEAFTKYGVLYNWPAATKICPSGWHLPTDKEWQEMESFLGMDTQQTSIRKWRQSGDVGKKLKASTGWFSNRGTDEFGFRALPAGCRGYNGFESENFCGYFWTGSPSSGDNGWRRTICFDEDGIDRTEDRRYFGCSVRCIKDE